MTFDPRALYGSEVMIVTRPSAAPGHRLVFHARNSTGSHREDDVVADTGEIVTRRWVSRARCGQLLYGATWRERSAGDGVPATVEPDSHRELGNAISFTIARALRIARPCQRCYPAQQLELIDEACA